MRLLKVKDGKGNFFPAKVMTRLEEGKKKRGGKSRQADLKENKEFSYLNAQVLC